MLTLLISFCLIINKTHRSSLAAHCSNIVSSHKTFHRAPAFVLKDTKGRRHSLMDFRGHSITLLFLCGCPSCAELTQGWAEAQRGGALSDATTRKHATITLIIYQGSADEAQSLASNSGLVPEQTILLIDRSMYVATLYKVVSCPRLFVLDARGNLRYTNNHKDDMARITSSQKIVGRALDALRKQNSDQQKR